MLIFNKQFRTEEKIISELIKKIKKSEKFVQSWDDLEEVYELLKLFGNAKHVSFDLGMLSKYNYYTGIIFKAYAYGLGDVLVKGGRYDHLLEAFGNSKPAVGFVIVVDDLMLALRSGHITVPVKAKAEVVTYNASNMKEKLAYVCRLRQEGKAACLVAED